MCVDYVEAKMNVQNGYVSCCDALSLRYNYMTHFIGQVRYVQQMVPY